MLPILLTGKAPWAGDAAMQHCGVSGIPVISPVERCCQSDREKKRAFDKKVSNRFWRGTDWREFRKKN